MKQEVLMRIKDFLEKYHNGTYIIDDSKLGLYVNTEYGRSSLVEQLAEAIHEFEVTDKVHYYYNEKIRQLNKMINLSFTHGIIKQGKSITEKVSALQEKIKHLEEKLKEKEIIIDSLKSEKDYWRGRYDTLAKYVPKPKLDDPLEGDVTDE